MSNQSQKTQKVSYKQFCEELNEHLEYDEQYKELLEQTDFLEFYEEYLEYLFEGWDFTVKGFCEFHFKDYSLDTHPYQLKNPKT